MDKVRRYRWRCPKTGRVVVVLEESFFKALVVASRELKEHGLIYDGHALNYEEPKHEEVGAQFIPFQATLLGDVDS